MQSRIVTQTPQRTHDAVLVQLKRHGEINVSELCRELKVTPMAVRRHLVRLIGDGLVESRAVKQARGRPSIYYRLSKNAGSVFPSNFEDLAFETLDVVQEKLGHKGVMEVLQRRNEKLVEKFRPRMMAKNLSDRVAEVCKIFTDSGYMTEWQALPDGNFLIYQRNCAIHAVADKYRQLCVLEPKLIEDLLEKKVTRSHYMLKNDPVCGYVVQAGS